MATPNVAIVSGYGINCETETAFAFTRAGAVATLIHINDLIEAPGKLQDYQILTFPGGFSFGDDTGSGNALANKVRHSALWDALQRFIERDSLTLGICNGFQVLVNLGLLPALHGRYGERHVALDHNASATYTCRWVDIALAGDSPWTQNIPTISLPVAHGEGRFYAPPDTLRTLLEKRLVAARYVHGEVAAYFGLPPNPNGSLEDIAGITDETGKIFGLMPHPERALSFYHLPHWTLLQQILLRKKKEIPTEGPGMKIFKNAVAHFMEESS